MNRWSSPIYTLSTWCLLRRASKGSLLVLLFLLSSLQVQIDSVFAIEKGLMSYLMS